MFDFFGSVRGLVKLDPICIDNNVFKLHYKATVILLAVCSLLVTSRQYFGDPIDCIVDGVPQNVMDTYCWIYATFTVSNKAHARVGTDVVHPGVRPYVDGEDQVVHHKYYQWVGFVLFFQAVFFYFPRYVWKMWESGRIAMLVLDLGSPMVSAENKVKQIKMLVEYFTANLHAHNLYAARFFLCEVFNFFNVVAQIYFVDYFLDGEFSKYGLGVLQFTDMDPEDRPDAMSRVFPKVTKCTFHKYGPSGSIQKIDGLCLLPLNVVNERIYVLIWFWFVFVAVLSFLNMLYRVAVLLLPKFRTMLLATRSRLAHKDDVRSVCSKFQVGDWFVLYQLSKSIEPLIFKELVSEMAMKLDDKQNV